MPIATDGVSPYTPVGQNAELSIEITQELIAQIGKLIFELEPSPVPDPTSDQWVSATHATIHPEGRWREVGSPRQMTS